MTQQPTRICILGGGFGGLYTALRLSKLPWEPGQRPEIILVDRDDRFVFTPLLYELITGELQTWEIAPPFSEVLANTGIRFYQNFVTGIDVDEQRVQLQDGLDLSYDRLVIALGGESPLDMVPGGVEYAMPFRRLTHAYRLEEQLRILQESNRDKIRIAIVGGGYCGVELACKLGDRLGERGRLRLIEQGDKILQASPEFNRNTAQKALDDRGIWIDLETTVESIGADTISLLYKAQVDTIPVDLVMWTVGTRVPSMIGALPLKQNAKGQLTTLPTLQVVDRPEIFALGDLANSYDAEGQQVPATAQVAIQQSDFAAWNIWASLTHRPQVPFRYYPFGEIMSLGSDAASLTGLGLKLDGSFGYIARRLAYLYRMPNVNHQVKVGLNWIAQPLLDLVLER